ncbi:hypothetical protein CcaverHIS631_0608580 [Cutaneotrichosporon cavernicola]|nr:hypothetical protein CcaverHIS631_0608580 [Cutaneotrichosporon cavernicola]BEJ09937.1 hypothetical protein CcaverHIS641_0608520 [Cutaneotrichosporon cavernicola]
MTSTAGPSGPTPVSTSLPASPTSTFPQTATSATTACTTTGTINPLALRVEERPGRGRGVFASGPIRAGVVLEEAPVLVLSKAQWEDGRMDDTVLGEYGFCWSNGGMALGLGIASLFNHSSSPNVNFIRNFATGTISFTTSRPVELDEELCICYSADETKLWFLPNGERPRPQTPSDDGDGSERLAALQLADDDAERQAREDKERARETRRQAGGNTHSAKEARRAKWRTKQEKMKNGDKGKIIAPQPVPAASGNGLLTEPASQRSQDSGRTITSGPTTVFALGERRVDLPAPLHSDSSKSRSDMPAEVPQPLEWDEAGPSELPDAQWGALRRARGPIEIEEEAEDDNTALIQVWALDATPGTYMKEVLDFTKRGVPLDERMRHLKRVRRITDDAGEERVLVALAMADTTNEHKLRSLLSTYDEILGALPLVVVDTPRSAAKTTEQLTVRNTYWPVLYTPGVQRYSDARGFSGPKLTWVRAGIERVLADALAAKARGELPVAVYVASTPESLYPQSDGFIPPTDGLAGAAADTRTSCNHPLRHAVLNAIASVARLRTVPPFSEITPSRNGADYLLTSMSLFVTHEPCVMCAMALLHSRVREVFFVFPRPRAGGFEGSFGVHSRRDLNHRFDAWRWTGPVDAEAYAVPDNVEI